MKRLDLPASRSGSEEGEDEVMVETPFEYSDDDDCVFTEHVDRTKKLTVRISEVIDINLYCPEEQHREDSFSESEEEDVSCEHLEGGLDDMACTEEEYELHHPSSRKFNIIAPLSEDESTLPSDDEATPPSDDEATPPPVEDEATPPPVEDETTPPPVALLDGLTMEDCIARMDDGISIASSAGESFSFASRSKSFINLFFGGGGGGDEAVGTP